MHDGRTRKVTLEGDAAAPTFFEENAASLTIVSGPAAGAEFTLDLMRQIAGRSASCAIRLEHESISSEHVAFELGEKGFGVRDLASTNGVKVNGEKVMSQALEHGDRVQLGDCELQYVVEARSREPLTWELDEAP